MPAGRPSDYDESYPEMLIKHMEQGLSFESFGGIVRVSKQTLYSWAEKYPEFLDAKNTGSMLSLLWWEQQGNNGLHNETIKTDDGMTVTRSINAQIYRLNMQCRFRDHGWADKASLELSGPDGKPIEHKDVTKLSDEELEAAIAAKLGKDKQE